MVGKVVYSILTGRYRPEEVLVLAFNRSAAHELQQRLASHMAYDHAGSAGAARATADIRVATMHALGLSVVRQQHRRALRVVDDVLDEVLAYLLQTDVAFADRWLFYRTFAHVLVKHPDECASAAAWRRFVKTHGQRSGRRVGFLTLRNEWVQTQFEQAVANWLYCHGLAYRYRPEGIGSSLARVCQGQLARPLSGRMVFILARSGCRLYCLSSPRRAPARAGGHRVLHVSLQDYRSGALPVRLRTLLCPDRRSPLTGRMRVVLGALGYRLGRSQRATLCRAVSLARLRDLAAADLAKAATGSHAPQHAGWYGPMLQQLVRSYRHIMQERGVTDYEGMLDLAAEQFVQGTSDHAYQLILVDEFQDTSPAAVRLLQAMLASRPKCDLFVVGDDWQSIYHFAGAQSDVLQTFQAQFGKAVVSQLTCTFRFDQHLANMATRFVQANPAQLAKPVRANRQGSASSVIHHAYDSVEHMWEWCERCLHTLAERIDVPMATVMILGRYQHQSPARLPAWRHAFSQLSIDYHTVHAAKGMEADAVILIGLETGRYGFPCTQDDDPLVCLVQRSNETFLHATERRLFYVALTRARYQLYLLGSAQHPSPFVQELGVTPS